MNYFFKLKTNLAAINQHRNFILSQEKVLKSLILNYFKSEVIGQCL